MAALQYKFIVQGNMPKLDTVTACSQVGEFTLFVGKIGTRSMAGIHMPKEAFKYSEDNTYRSSIKHSIKKLLGDWIGFGNAQSVTIGWTNYPSIVTYDNSYVQPCTFSDGMTEFAALSTWIRKVLSWPVRQQKFGWTASQVDDWLDSQLKKRRRVKNVTTRSTSGSSPGPAESNAGPDLLDSQRLSD